MKHPLQLMLSAWLVLFAMVPGLTLAEQTAEPGLNEATFKGLEWRGL